MLLIISAVIFTIILFLCYIVRADFLYKLKLLKPRFQEGDWVYMESTLRKGEVIKLKVLKVDNTHYHYSYYFDDIGFIPEVNRSLISTFDACFRLLRKTNHLKLVK